MLYLTQVKRKLHPFSRRQLSGTVKKYLKELNLKAEWAGLGFSFLRFGCMVDSVTLRSNLRKSWLVLGEATHLMVARKQARGGEGTNKRNP